jgi:hypothetical protein
VTFDSEKLVNIIHADGKEKLAAMIVFVVEASDQSRP